MKKKVTKEKDINRIEKSRVEYIDNCATVVPQL